MLDEMYKEVRELQEILGYNDPKRIAQEQRLKVRGKDSHKNGPLRKN